MDELSPNWIVGYDHKSLSWVELLAEFNNALQIVIENVLALKIKLALA